MSRLFEDVKIEFNVSDWEVSKVTNMERMFYYAKTFNQPLDNWNVSRVTTMEKMFQDAESFDQPLNNWDICKVTEMYGMFYLLSIKTSICFRIQNNLILDDWNTQNVINMSWMFLEASAFNQDIKDWKVDNVKQWTDFATGSPLKCHQIPEKLGKG